jgi:glycogen(starch) synthase
MAIKGNPMRIVFMISLYPPYIVGGNEMITFDLVETLRKQGDDVHVLTAQGRRLDGIPHIHQIFNYSLDDKEAIFQGGRRLSLIELFRHHVFDPVTYYNVQRVIRQLQPDLIVADNLYMVSAAPLLAVRDEECPIMVQAMDKWLVYCLIDWGLAVKPVTMTQKLFVGAVRRFIQRPIAACVRLDGIATVSNFIRDFHIRAGFAPEMLQAVYLGYDSEVFYPGPFHPLHDPVRLIFAGTLWEGKGAQVVVQALHVLDQMDDMPRFHLRLFGEGGEAFKQYLREIIRELDVEQWVTFHGFAPWQELVQEMHQSDIFVFPSIWNEPFATAPLQAAGCGLPVVATLAGGTPEGFTDGETALLIPPNDAQAMADAIARLVRDEDLRRRLCENGARETQKQWSFEAYVERFLDYSQHVTNHWRQSRKASTSTGKESSLKVHA